MTTGEEDEDVDAGQPTMAEPLPNRDAFAPLVDTTFRLITSTGDHLMRLVSLEDGRPSDSYEQFSLFFLAPPAAPIEQGVYGIEHEAIGRLDLFLVPVAGGEAGIEYQAVCSRALEDRHGAG